jgi:hypothetical protein
MFIGVQRGGEPLGPLLKIRPILILHLATSEYWILFLVTGAVCRWSCASSLPLPRALLARLPHPIHQAPSRRIAFPHYPEKVDVEKLSP